MSATRSLQDTDIKIQSSTYTYTHCFYKSSPLKISKQ